MKSLTTNKIKSFIKNNQYGKYYFFNEIDVNFYYKKLGKNVYLNDNNLSKYRNMPLTFFQNSIKRCYFSEAFYKKFKVKYNNYIKGNFDYLGCEFSYSCTIQENLTWLIILYTNYRNIPCTNVYNIKFEFKGSFKNIQKECIKQFEKFLYKDGAFKNFQIKNGYTKEMVKRSLKNNIYGHFKNKGKILNSYNDEIIEKWIIRNFNINIKEVNFFTGIKFVNKNGKQNNLIVLENFDYNYFESFDGDIDELEKEFYEYNDSFEKNIVLI